MRDPIPGWLEINGWTEPVSGGTPVWRVTGTILASGILPTSAVWRTDRPGPWGSRLPVTVDRTNPLNFEVDWERFRQAPPQPRKPPREILPPPTRAALPPAASRPSPQTGFTERAAAMVSAVYEVLGNPADTASAGMVDLILDVQRADGRRQRASARIGFSTPARRAAVAQVGTPLPVLLDPDNPAHVLIDVTQLTPS
jgi:hypothetical protein